MPTTELEPRESEHDRVERWRTYMLERAGYSTEAAAELAPRLDIDLHHAIGLLERGCTPEIALQILL